MTRTIPVSCLLCLSSMLIAADGPPGDHAVARLPVAKSDATESTAASPAPAGKSGALLPAHRWRPRTSPVWRVAAANRAATQEPEARSYINATQIYGFSDGMIYRIYAAPERVTDIALQPGEALGAVAAGDTVRWTIGDTTSGSGDGKRTHVLLKPFAIGLSTNVVITTDRRSYHLSLRSTSVAGAMAAISWTYPQDAMIAIQRKQEEAKAAAPVAQGLPLDQLSFAYTISGDNPSWKPLRAFDDGRQTFIEFPASLATGEAPPLFVVGPKGEAELVNYRLRGRFYVVDRLFDAAELRLGAKHQDIVRIARDAPNAAARRSS